MNFPVVVISGAILLLSLNLTNAQVGRRRFRTKSYIDGNIIGDRCVMEDSGQYGTCQVSTNCPEVEEQAKLGITPTICSGNEYPTPIICCESSYLPQPNDNTFLTDYNSNKDSRNNSSHSNRPTNNYNPDSIVYPTERTTEKHTYFTQKPRPGSQSANNQFGNQGNQGSRPRPGGQGFNNQGNQGNQFGGNGNQFNNHGSRPQSGNQGHNNQGNQFGNQNSQSGNQGNQFNHQGQNNHDNQRISKSEQKCNEYTKALTTMLQVIPLVTDTYGTSITVEKCTHDGVPLVVGGKPAVAGEFPFMAAIGFYVDDIVDWKCGGTLISERFILTAAHCTFSRDSDGPKVIRLGDLDLTRSDDGSIHAEYEIDSVIVHPEYRYPRKYNDISLLKTKRKVKFTKFIRPACLYTKRHFEVSSAIATGYGKTDFTAAENSNKLMKVALDLFDKSVCDDSYTQNKYLPQGVVSTMICAGKLKGGMDTCQGDSGGPLFVTHKDNHCKFFIIGVTSFGRGCAAKNIPAIYTRVSSFIPWIEKTIW